MVVHRLSGKTRKQWADKVVLKDDKAIQLKCIGKVGGGHYLSIPKVWIDLACIEVDGEYWVEVEINAKRIAIIGYKGQL